MTKIKTFLVNIKDLEPTVNKWLMENIDTSPRVNVVSISHNIVGDIMVLTTIVYEVLS